MDFVTAPKYRVGFSDRVAYYGVQSGLDARVDLADDSRFVNLLLGRRPGSRAASKENDGRQGQIATSGDIGYKPRDHGFSFIPRIIIHHAGYDIWARD
jgi:hypothetical protein